MMKLGKVNLRASITLEVDGDSLDQFERWILFGKLAHCNNQLLERYTEPGGNILYPRREAAVELSESVDQLELIGPFQSSAFAHDVTLGDPGDEQRIDAGWKPGLLEDRQHGLGLGVASASTHPE